MRTKFILCTFVGVVASACASEHAKRSPSAPLASHVRAEDTRQRHGVRPENFEPSAAYELLDMLLEASARDVERIGARPTILSRQMAIPVTAMFDAWAAYDGVALGTYFGGDLRRPREERTEANKRVAIAHALYVAALDQLPHQADYLRAEFERLGFDPRSESLDRTAPAGLGRLVAQAIVRARHADGANQLGDEVGSGGEPYDDYTMYRPANTPTRVLDPDRWQPIPFDDSRGGQVVLGFLTPHWYRVRPFGLERADMFRPGPPPLYGSRELQEQVDECIILNATLTPEQKAEVEFMRDGPRSTAQSGHWLRFAQDVSVRDRHDLDQDVQLYFAVANTAFDAFIASWDSKRYYDSSRPWTLVRALYAGRHILGWGGPGAGSIELPAEEWRPYSPSSFVTPPFPGYVSGHSAVSAACAEMLRLCTGSDRFGVIEERVAGSSTEEGATCDEMQRSEGKVVRGRDGEPMTCDVQMPLETFSATAAMAGQSRVLGGYHIEADNTAGLELGRNVARHLFPKVRAYIDGVSLGSR